MSVVTTGNRNADRVLGLILARVHAFPRAMSDDIRDGVQSIFIPYPYLEFHAELERTDVELALNLLVEKGLLRIERGPLSNAHGCDVWIRGRSEAVAA